MKVKIFFQLALNDKILTLENLAHRRCNKVAKTTCGPSYGQMPLRGPDMIELQCVLQSFHSPRYPEENVVLLGT